MANKNGNEKKKRKKYMDMTVAELEQEKIKINAIKKEADNKLEMISGLLLVKKVQATKDQEIADKNAEIERLKKQLQEQAPIQSTQTTHTPKTSEVQSGQIKLNTPNPTTISSAEAEARKETKEDRIKKLGIGLPLK